MKYPVRRFKNLIVCLKELEPFVRDGQHLLTGKPFKRFGGMRSREVLANWLICVAANSEHRVDRFTFTSDPIGSDGIILDTVTQTSWPTEHIMVPKARPNVAAEKKRDIGTRILDAVVLKQNKGGGGAAYARGKQLVVFIDADGGPWFPNKIVKQLPRPLDFDEVWAVGLQGVEAGVYVYGVTQLKFPVAGGNAPTWLVLIGKDFDTWRVERAQ